MATLTGGALAAWRLADMTSASMGICGLLVGGCIGAIERHGGRAVTAGSTLASALLRLGVVLLGLRVSLDNAFVLGLQGLGVVLIVVLSAFGLAVVLGSRLGLTPSLALLVGAGFSICGASAVAAMSPVARASSREVTVAMAFVAVFGAGATLLVPAILVEAGVGPTAVGATVGATVHDVGQVIAAAEGAGESADTGMAVTVKLTRVLLLAPLLLVAPALVGSPGDDRRRKFHPPLFILGFVLVAILAGLVDLSDGITHLGATAERWCISAGLVAIGARTSVTDLRGTGLRPLLLASVVMVAILLTSLAGMLTLGL